MLWGICQLSKMQYSPQGVFKPNKEKENFNNSFNDVRMLKDITVNRNTVSIMVTRLKLRQKKCQKMFEFSSYLAITDLLGSFYECLQGPALSLLPHEPTHISGWHFSWWFNTSPGRPECVIFTNGWLQLRGIALIVACAMLKWSGALWSRKRLSAINGVALRVPCVILQVVLQLEPRTCFGK